MKPMQMVVVKDRVRYDVSKSTCLAHDAYWDGHNWERHGRNQFLFRTPKGRYFMQYVTQWEGELDRLVPIEQDEAIRLFEDLPEHDVQFAEAFPDIKVEEA